ncbi:hypothetical protein V5O48_011330 [Marasmius crinis-equi]|uniref:F-box domain-containing protein n=1 Tax=Marasmius crinis-equi TaxID=585013 RepID=A0ABR3F5X6_9AGAR
MSHLSLQTPVADLSSRGRLPFRTTITQSNANDIKRLVSDIEQEKKGYVAEIKKLRVAMMVLEGKEDVAQKKLDYLKSLLSPIHRIPPEILLDIFRLCCPTHGRLSIDGPSSSPDQLSKVCGFWRNIIAGSPSLWSGICVCIHPSKNSLRATKRMLDLSGSAPLMLSLSYMLDDFNMTHEDDGTPKALTDLLVSHSDRWKSLILDITTAGSRLPSLQAIRGRLDKLTNLTIDCLDGDVEFDERFLRVFEHAPSLYSVQLIDGPAHADFVLPWQQLETIHLEQCDLERILEILKLCPNATRVKLGLPQIFTEPSCYARLPKVAALLTKLVAPEMMTSLFQRLVIPNIKSLDIRNECTVDRDAPWDLSAVQVALGRSSNTLTSLYVKNIPINDKQMISFLQSAPNLEELSIWEYKPYFVSKPLKNNIVTPNLLNRLSLCDADLPQSMFDSVHGGFLPRLRALTLHVHVKGLDQRALTNSVVSRCPPIGQEGPSWGKDGNVEHYLQSLELGLMVLEGEDPLDIGPLLTLECFRKVGVCVEVKIEELT